MKYLDIFNKTGALLIIFALSVHVTLPEVIAQNSTLQLRDSLLLNLENNIAEAQANENGIISSCRNLISFDNDIIKVLNDSLLILNESIRSNKVEHQKTLAGINDKLDRIDDRKTKLERTVMVLILVLLMLTYYIFKLQKNSQGSKE